MKTIEFKEIIESSTQKSIVSGMPGFGIRTYTKGINAEIVGKISEALNCTYDIPVSRQVTFNKLQEDPTVTTRYPRTIKYTKVKGADNEEYYAIACSTYIGIDYGFFCDMDTARRAGSNYIADIILFHERPSAQIFYQLVSQQIFLPKDNTCNPDNPELKELLTGVPTLLDPRSVSLKDNADGQPALTALTAQVAIAFLQAKINGDLGKEETFRDIVVNAKESVTPDVLKAMAVLPDELVGDMYFQTNYLQGYGVPTGYRMVFLNEYNEDEVYTDNYVYLDLKDGNNKNIDTNYYFNEIVEAANDNNYSLFFALVSYLPNTHISADTDYQFVYKLFAATEGVVPLTVDDLTQDFFEKVEALNLPKNKKEALRKTVADILNPALQSDNEKALNITRYLVEHKSDILDIKSDTRQTMTDMIFSKGALGKYIRTYGLDLVDYINTHKIDDSTFFTAMQSVDDAGIWEHIVRDQFGNSLTDRADEIISTVLQTRIVDRERLIVDLFPIDSNKEIYHNYITYHPGRIQQVNGIIRHIAMGGGENAMLKILSETKYSADVFNVLQPVAIDYFMHQVRQDAHNGAENAATFLLKIKEKMDRTFDFSSLFDLYAKECEKNPAKADKELLRKLTDADIKLSPDSDKLFSTILVVGNPDTKVENLDGTFDELLIGRYVINDEQKLLALFDKWVVNKMPHRKEIGRFMQTGKPLSFEFVGGMLQAIWQHPNFSEEYRHSHVLYIIRTAKWSKVDRKTFIASCTNNELKDFLNSSYGFVNIVKALFSKKKK